MIKIYRKTATIKAEKFDGSNEMADKYDIEVVEGDYAEDYSMPEAGPAPYFRYFMANGYNEVYVGDWIATGINGEHWPITDDVFKRTYAELPVISKEVADWIELGKSKGISLDTALMIIMAGRTESPDISGVSKWIWHYHMADVAIAWNIGYQLEAKKG